MKAKKDVTEPRRGDSFGIRRLFVKTEPYVGYAQESDGVLRTDNEPHRSIQHAHPPFLYGPPPDVQEDFDGEAA